MPATPFFDYRNSHPIGGRMALDAKPRWGLARDEVSEEVAAKLRGANDPISALGIFLEEHCRLSPDDLAKAQELTHEIVKDLGRQADEEQEEREREEELKQLKAKAAKAEDGLRRIRSGRDQRHAMDAAPGGDLLGMFPGLSRIRLS